jgi:hypothetical protein
MVAMTSLARWTTWAGMPALTIASTASLFSLLPAQTYTFTQKNNDVKNDSGCSIILEYLTGEEAGCVCVLQGSGIRKAVLGIRIRMFLGLANPGPLVRGTAPDPDPSLFS